MIETRDVFQLIGLDEDWNAMADERPGYVFKDERIDISINQVSGRTFRQVLFVTGTASNKRTSKQVMFELPLQIASVEIALALLAVNIGHEYISDESVFWLRLGKKWKDVLANRED